MTQILISGTILMAFALLLARLLPQGAHEARRRVLLGGWILLLVMPLAAWATLRGHWGLECSSRLAASAPLAGAFSDFLGKAIWLWAIGALASLVRFAWRLTLAYGLVRSADRPSKRELGRLRHVLPSAEGDVSARIRWSSRVAGPCVVPGFAAACVLLPLAARTWDQRLLSHVLRHEWEHVRRGDVWWRLIAEVVRALWWFHPLAHGLIRRWMDQCEHVCDAAVLHGGAPPESYARSLLKLAAAPARAMVPVGFAAAAGSRLRPRVEAILRGMPEAAARSALLGWLALGLLVLLGAMTAVVRIRHSTETGAAHARSIHAEAQRRLQADPFPGNG